MDDDYYRRKSRKHQEMIWPLLWFYVAVLLLSFVLWLLQPQSDETRPQDGEDGAVTEPEGR